MSITLAGMGLNRFFIFLEAANLLKASTSTATNLVENSHQNDPWKFAKLGSDLGGVVSGLGMLGANIAMPIDEILRSRSNFGFNMKTGFTADHNIEMWKVNMKGRNPFFLNDKYAKNATMRIYDKGGSMSKVWVNPNTKEPRKNGMSTKEPRKNVMSTKKVGLGRYALGMVGVAAATMAVQGALTAAGAFIDQQVQGNRKMSQISYDTRQIDTTRFDQPVAERAMEAMYSMQNNNMSVARIYHGR